jgi:hypothetical protein
MLLFSCANSNAARNAAHAVIDIVVRIFPFLFAGVNGRDISKGYEAIKWMWY